MANEQRVTTTERLWSDEVGIAAASDPNGAIDPNRVPGYEFSNGRTFNSGLGDYEPTANP